MKQVKIGLIGTGFMGRAHAICYSQIPAAALTRVCSASLEKARQFADEFSIAKASDRWMDVMDDDEVEVVDVTAPNWLHAEIAIAAARAGKHIIMEKPLALNLTQADKVMDEVRCAGVKAMYAENRRFSPVLTKAWEVIRSGKIGSPVLLRINELGGGPTHGEWFWDHSKTGGGALIDLGIHGLFTAEWLMGSRVVQVSSTSGLIKWKGRVAGGAEDTVLTNCVYENGALGQLVCSWAVSGGLDIRVEVFGTLGTIKIDQARQINGMELYVEPRWNSVADTGSEEMPTARPHIASEFGWSYPMVNEWVTRGHLYELHHFVECVEKDIDPLCTFEDGYRCMQLADAVYQSAARGTAVRVPGMKE